MFKKVRGAGDNSSFLSRLTGLRRRRVSSSKSRSILRRLLNEQLEPRQLLAADIHGDTLATAMQLSLQANQQTEIQATIGDGDYGAKDVDLYRVHLAVGQTLQVDIDAGLTDAGNMLSSLDSFLRVLNSSGVELAINSSGKAPNDYSYGGYVGYGGYGPSPDSFLTFQAPASGDYYIGVSGESYDYYYGGASGNRTYNPNLPNSGVSSSTGNYVLQLVTDTPPTPKLSIANVTVLESSGTASVTVSLSPAPVRRLASIMPQLTEVLHLEQTTPTLREC